MKFVRLVIDSRVLLYPEEVEAVFFRAAEAARLDEVVTHLGKVKEFSHNYKIS